MKFSVNVGQLARALEPAVNVATENTASSCDWVRKVTLQAEGDKILARANGGTAAVLTKISENAFYNLRYSCEDKGIITVDATDFSKSLRAFPASEDVVVSNACDEVIIARRLNKEEIQSLPTTEPEVSLPPICKKFGKIIRVDREVFVRGLQKVKFAVGSRKTTPYCMVELFEVEPGKVRFAGGSGAFFAVLDVAGKNMVTTTNKQSILFPRDNLENIIKILSEASSKVITIKQTSEVDNTCQILIEFDDSTLFVLVSDPAIKYPPLDNVLNYDYPCKIYSKVADWRYAMRGVDATYNDEIKSENDFHTVDVFVYVTGGYLILEPRSKMKAKRKVKLSYCDVPDSASKEQKPQQFRCSSQHLLEVASKAREDEEIVISFANQTQRGKQRPALVKYPEKVNKAKGIKEQFMIMFATSLR